MLVHIVYIRLIDRLVGSFSLIEVHFVERKRKVEEKKVMNILLSIIIVYMTI